MIATDNNDSHATQNDRGRWVGFVDRVRVLGLGCALVVVGCSGGGTLNDNNTRKSGGTDVTPPVISDVQVSPDQTSALISWRTDEPANSAVKYGLTSSLGIGTVSDAKLEKAHQIKLDKLVANRMYLFEIVCADESGNAAKKAGLSFKTRSAPDTKAPVISNIGVITTHDTATITWVTDELANGRVDFGLTASYSGGSVRDTNFFVGHEVQLTGLTPKTTYHFRITSADPSGNSSSSTDQVLQTNDKPQVGSKASISQFGITWTFDKAYPAGQFANGDWWVVGPVKVVKIDPPSVSGSRVKNGSMINPSPRLGSNQGYDSAMKVSTYTPSLNVALDVSSRKPLKVPANSSLVSTISMDPAGNRPQLKGCSILTILTAVAKVGDFRPPYCGAVKTPRFNASQLNYSLLRKLEPTSKTPSMASVERMFERPWLDHAPGWGGREYHPKDNMRDYGRDLAAEMSVGALMLHLDFSNQQKAVLLKRFVQLGIDLQGIVDDGGDKNWVNNGGHASGRKWPILFAGLILNDTKMKGIGSTSVAFGEDQQTFIVKETKSGVFNNGYGGYTSKNKGMPEWGINHATRPERDSVSWTAKYRQCCTANCWNGFVLCAHIMGAKPLWNHDVLFAYVDRYIPEARSRKEPGWIVSWNSWTIEMWDAYRENY